MYDLLVKLMLVSALIELGLSQADKQNGHGFHDGRTFEQTSRSTLNIDWKPISIFPDQGRRFR